MKTFHAYAAFIAAAVSFSILQHASAAEQTQAAVVRTAAQQEKFNKLSENGKITAERLCRGLRNKDYWTAFSEAGRQNAERRNKPYCESIGFTYVAPVMPSSIVASLAAAQSK